jgi:PIN domain nuclease of toxin-antitoxin system
VSLLLDTSTLLWFLSNDPKLSETARAAIEEPANVRWTSPGSLFEIAIKVRLGKLPLDAPFGAIFPAKLSSSAIHLLPLEAHQIEPLTTFPFHHRDPFDRLIAATALVEGLTLVSADPVFDAYGVTRLW